MPAGRPSKFKPEMCEQAAKLCDLGATDMEIADFFDVDVASIYRWKNEHSEFCEALKVAKLNADNRVERSLYQRAIGYSHPAVKLFQNAGEVVEANYTEHYPPDTTAGIFWLKNRKPEEWRDVTRHEQTGPNGGPLQVEHSPGELAMAILSRFSEAAKDK